jgi:hypothetical protein
VMLTQRKIHRLFLRHAALRQPPQQIIDGDHQ